ncbi:MULTISPECIES: glucosamine-6-phosphate deaminase [Clavibacter]|uniref:Glucosamine-6-phosphate deaminase n=1 Tax=Clavibacter tessellarius TaxID=31965 RepID=A0A154V4C6_9MICO|nr:MULTISPECIES: glucosamine-6-phosphate deaminase [Clavibacter]KZC96220.1 glucosamine-6-phosphate deaminase [Clavibacter michiganensis subsp. tessellarius]MDA3804688.1 glucosamine-6-phosphate deaminase [Clavibacter sp. CT19]
MEVVVVPTAEDAAPLVADACSALLERRPDAVLGLATGSTPLPLYRELIRRHREEGLSFARARAFLLDEYVGLPAGHPERYRAFIAEELERHVDFAPGAIRGPGDAGSDPLEEGPAYERAIREAGGIDLQVLGIGTDGHLAFNMPMSSLGSRTRLKTLTARTRRDNARFFGDDVDRVPTHCLTQGLATILDSRHAIMLGFGRAKAQAVRAAVEGALSARWPASVLQLHPHATVVVDEEAAAELEFVEHYRETFAGKPAGQGL